MHWFIFFYENASKISCYKYHVGILQYDYKVSNSPNYEAARKQTSIFYVLMLFSGILNIGQEHGICRDTQDRREEMYSGPRCSNVPVFLQRRKRLGATRFISVSWPHTGPQCLLKHSTCKRRDIGEIKIHLKKKADYSYPTSIELQIWHEIVKYKWFK